MRSGLVASDGSALRWGSSVFEEVCRLVVDLERVDVVEEIEVEAILIGHAVSVIHSNTFVYGMV
jgi:hypothetical protein